MSLKKILRMAIIFDWFTTILYVVVSEILESSLPSQLQDYLKWEANKELTITENLIFIPVILLLVVYLISSIGLFLYKPWAKQIYIVVAFLLVALVPFAGPTVDHALTSTIGEINNINFGFIFTLLIFTNAYKTDEIDA
ncbi:hypothetical protein DSLASN_18530 [Desulfoluna limicola]|uniref:Uncharacterized protein n=1 Tax=Desulfoluna limicola TaxID=2810562 RepID=A0ABN6F2T9_9BACT|nr:hypothetical protein [Desulfoluna limicola]BCS96215.1 hypothetical protein DSLASN_18470 [Desulfoluna limicola]BCS96221.1 hypothetical protein DSLASN_18530 [Desulfoluna limicola]